MGALKDLIKNPTVAEMELIAAYGEVSENPRRERMFEAFAQTGLPSRRTEAWRWSDIRGSLKSFEAGDVDLIPTDPFDGIEAGFVVEFAPDGRVSVPATLPDGIRIIEQDDANALGGAEDIPMAALAAALATSPGAIVIEVSKSQSLPIRIVNRTAAEKRFGRIAVVVRDEAEVTVLESHLSGGGFSSLVVEYGLQDGAVANRIVAQRATDTATQIVTGTAHLNRDAKFHQTGLSFGAKLCRLETRLSFMGPNGEASFNQAYLLGAGYHADHTSHVRHSADNCVTRQICKGAVKDEGRGVFQGKFFVARKAQHTDAEMAHHAILLENGADVNAKPELEIYADDVQCAHGNTAGSLDADALFYLRQRGIPETKAKALLTEAFVAEAFDDLGETPVADILREEARSWLTANL